MALDRKLYLREYQRVWVKRRRTEFFIGKECARCGAKERLELDHIDPSTKISNTIWSWSEKRRMTEANKCQILCYGCHKRKSAEYCRQLRKGIPQEQFRTLKPSQVRDIRKMLAAGLSERKVAKYFGRCKGTVHSIRIGVTYTNIK